MIAIILIWAGVGQIYWQLSPHISTYTDRSTSASLYQVINGITVIGIDLLVIFLAKILSQRKTTPELIIGKGWLNTLSLGLLSCVIVGLISYDDISANYLDALLPFLRNTYPLIFGSLIGLILCRLANGLSKSRLKLLISLVLVLFTTAMVVSPNGYGWSSKTNTLYLYLPGFN